MIWNMLLLAVILGVGGGAIVRDAWLDKTPRRPWTWRRPELEWWAVRQTKREKARGAIAMETKR